MRAATDAGDASGRVGRGAAPVCETDRDGEMPRDDGLKVCHRWHDV